MNFSDFHKQHFTLYVVTFDGFDMKSIFKCFKEMNCIKMGLGT